jgi:hypothetical protein
VNGVLEVEPLKNEAPELNAASEEVGEEGRFAYLSNSLVCHVILLFCNMQSKRPSDCPWHLIL